MRARKRANGEGSILLRKDGLWMAKASLPDGTRKSVYARSRAEVVRKLTAVQRLAAQGLRVTDERMTVAALMDEWLTSRIGVLRQTTVETYGHHLALARPTLGRLRVARLQPRDLERVYSTLRANGSAPMTVRHVHAVLHAMLEHAAEQGRVHRNVASLVSPPSGGHREMATLTADEARRLLRAASDDPLEALYVLALTTGMRRGELLALQWRDVYLKGRVLQVTGNLVREDGHLKVGPPKTARSRHTVKLGTLPVDALRRHREASKGEGFVFVTEVGTPLLERAGLPHMRFHDLRHTAATLQLSMGTHPKVVADLLGHASVTVTLDTYSHAVKGIAEQAAADMDALLRA